MKILKYLLFIIVVLFLIGLMLPSKLHVERSMKTQAKAEQIFALVNDLKAYKQWDPWSQKDPNMKTEFKSNTAGVGAGYSWTSEHEMVGNGSMEITESIPNEKVSTKLNFGENGDAIGTFTIKQENDGNTMTWSMESDNSSRPFYKRAIDNYFNLLMDGMIGKEFLIGLANLDKLAPSVNLQPTGKVIETVLSEIKDMHIIQIETAANFSNVSEKMEELYARISKKIEDNKQTIAGAPMAMFPGYKPGDTSFQLAAMMSITEKCNKKCDADMKCHTIAATKVIKCTYMGPYEATNIAYETIQAMMKEKNLQANGEPWEEYTNDPDEVKDPALFTTVVYQPIK